MSHNEEIKKLQEEIKELEELEELKKLKRRKLSLKHEGKKVIKGDCPNCSERLVFEEEEKLDGVATCEECGNTFDIDEAKNKLFEDQIEKEIKPTDRTRSSDDGILKFEKDLGNYKIYVVLSILFDILFIFTILSFSYASSLNTSIKYGEIPENKRSSFYNWRTVFIIFFILKILAFCFSLLAALSGYDY